MRPVSASAFARLGRLCRIFLLTRTERRFLRAARASGQFDPVYYAGAYPNIHPLFRPFLLRHYVVYGEARGFRPNPDFSPSAYLHYNADVAGIGMSPFFHWVQGGHAEGRIHKELPQVEELPDSAAPRLDVDRARKTARVAIVMHVYYPDLWPEFAQTLRDVKIPYDLYVTLTWRGDETEGLATEIRAAFPAARVVPVENRGRDILPFLTLVNSGLLDDYAAVCKIHTKKSPHREDGDHWRRHLIGGVLPDENLPAMLDAFIADDSAAFWVADGQFYDDTRWWGSNFEVTAALLRRVEIEIGRDRLSFPAGSIYWIKPLMVGMLKAMRLGTPQFDTELAQVDGTLAHGMERAMGFLAVEAGQRVLQTAELAELAQRGVPEPLRPAHTSAFYLPQFHPVPENDLWWGKGFTEWRGTVAAQSVFAGHTQPVLPADLGYYDLRVTETMGEQAALAGQAGIDAFCVYHYWFDGRRILEQPLDRLLERPEIAFPFYLCWANESWRRNWDGLSGTVLLPQTYAPGFEADLVADSLPYMRDARYARPDGTRPRFVIYRPEDMPDPAGSVARMRTAWRAAGIGEVELGAVRFHVEGKHPVADDLFDFWVEMPPHGLVTGDDYLFGGPDGNLLGRDVARGFTGLVYDYARVIANALSRRYADRLPAATIRGAMPSWDNSARRGSAAHIAYGANPASFRRWLAGLAGEQAGGPVKSRNATRAVAGKVDTGSAGTVKGGKVSAGKAPSGKGNTGAAPLATSYRHELFLNAWNEWAEKAILEPSQNWGGLYLRVLHDRIKGPARADAAGFATNAPSDIATGTATGPRTVTTTGTGTGIATGIPTGTDARPAATMPDTRSSDAPVPDTRSSDAPVPETRSSDAPVPDTRSSDAPVPGDRSPAAPVPETRSSDAPVPETRSSDAPVPDTRSSDAPVPGDRPASDAPASS